MFATWHRGTPAPAKGVDVGKMRILDTSGDTVIAWEIDNDISVREAEAVFRRQLLARQFAFARRSGGTAEEAERIVSFDPRADEILWVRPIQGG